MQWKSADSRIWTAENFSFTITHSFLAGDKKSIILQIQAKDHPMTNENFHRQNKPIQYKLQPY